MKYLTTQARIFMVVCERCAAGFSVEVVAHA